MISARVWLFAGLFTLGGMPQASGADFLSYELKRSETRGLSGLAEVTAQRFNLAPADLPALEDKRLRSRVALDLATRQTLNEIAGARYAATVPGLRELAGDLVGDPDAASRLKRDPVLAHTVARLRPGHSGTEMTGAEREIVSNGGTQVPPGFPPTPVPETVLAQVVADNHLPDLDALGFSLAFVVELHVGNQRCSGALLAPKLVITARHCVIGRPGAPDLPVEGTSIEVRVAGGTKIVRGAGSPIVLEIEPGQTPGHIHYRDVALVQLDDTPTGPITFARVASAKTEHLWVIMAGFGFTHVTAPSGWTKAYVARQLVNFKKFASYYPADAAVPWDATPIPASQCVGDSGGPVFIVGPNKEPVVIGVLSRAVNSPTNTITSCARSGGAKFINFGHPYVQGAFCQKLASAGGQCLSPLPFIKRA